MHMSILVFDNIPIKLFPCYSSCLHAAVRIFRLPQRQAVEEFPSFFLLLVCKTAVAPVVEPLFPTFAWWFFSRAVLSEAVRERPAAVNGDGEPERVQRWRVERKLLNVPRVFFVGGGKKRRKKLCAMMERNHPSLGWDGAPLEMRVAIKSDVKTSIFQMTKECSPNPANQSAHPTELRQKMLHPGAVQKI